MTGLDSIASTYVSLAAVQRGLLLLMCAHGNIGLMYSGVGRFDNRLVWSIGLVGLFYAVKGAFPLCVII